MARYPYKKLYEWNSDIAYLTGLIASDGCLLNDARHLNITSKDMEIINTVKQILSLKAEHRVKIGGFGTPAFHLQFSDVSLYDFCSRAGLTCAKSLTLPALDVPDCYYADFLRGHFDGDGTIYGYKDARWPNSTMFYCQFISASQPFLDWVNETNSRLFTTTRVRIKQGERAYILSYAKADSKKLFSAMYRMPQNFKLTRKYDKFIAFLRSDPYAIKE